MSDPFGLVRFVEAQEPVQAQALDELRRGRKETHWMWFVFPQLEGLGTSENARRYAIHGLEEARAYLEHPILGPRLRDFCRVLLSIHGRSAFEILGSPDDRKLQSSMTLFARVAGPDPEFSRVLDRYFSGEPDPRTLQLLSGGSGKAALPG